MPVGLSRKHTAYYWGSKLKSENSKILLKNPTYLFANLKTPTGDADTIWHSLGLSSVLQSE
ncbi:15899_t:CDS:2 [Cetraspora pellucida]|uniref:15899_t:CDS:1 n=1 Tax=Cetraspora pellucida TaxID=1433469 RepID=A0A9N9A8N4_9GLOM|nr:15899_t:CDS:2 [Cetraspora pellucida]